jgi:hypothetical protein
LPLEPDDVFYKKASMLAAMPRFNQKKRRVENFKAMEITLGRDLGK